MISLKEQLKSLFDISDLEYIVYSSLYNVDESIKYLSHFKKKNISLDDFDNFVSGGNLSSQMTVDLLEIYGINLPLYIISYTSNGVMSNRLRYKEFNRDLILTLIENE